jgi:hypothetical protein
MNENSMSKIHRRYSRLARAVIAMFVFAVGMLGGAGVAAFRPEHATWRGIPAPDHSRFVLSIAASSGDASIFTPALARSDPLSHRADCVSMANTPDLACA